MSKEGPVGEVGKKGLGGGGGEKEKKKREKKKTNKVRQTKKKRVNEVEEALFFRTNRCVFVFPAKSRKTNCLPFSLSHLLFFTTKEQELT